MRLPSLKASCISSIVLEGTVTKHCQSHPQSSPVIIDGRVAVAMNTGLYCAVHSLPEFVLSGNILRIHDFLSDSKARSKQLFKSHHSLILLL